MTNLHHFFENQTQLRQKKKKKQKLEDQLNIFE